jgi:hypothetical protein
MVSNALGKITDFNPSQPSNAYSPMLVMLFGILTLVMSLLDSNA